MQARPQSGHVVLLVDPARDAEATRRGLKCRQRLGLIRTAKGVYWVYDDGTGGGPVNGKPCQVWFEDASGAVVEADFTLAELDALLTGQAARLDEHVAAGHDQQFWHWQRKLDKIEVARQAQEATGQEPPANGMALA